MNIPFDLGYSNDHEWVRAEGNIATIGITDFAQSQLGDIVYLDVPTVGQTMERGEVFGSIEAVKTVSDAILPVSGKVIELNAELDAHPELVNSDPYGRGWIVRVQMSDPSQVKSLLTAEDYKKIIE